MAIPPAADEATTLTAFLDHVRATLLRQCEDLDADQLAQRLDPSPMCLGGMLKHLVFVEQWWFRVVFAGLEPDGVWADVDWEADEDWDWHSWRDQSPAELAAMLRAEAERSRATVAAALADGGLDTLAVREGRHGRVSLRWILVHMVEEYARHCGHADLIRESVDGRTGL